MSKLIRNIIAAALIMAASSLAASDPAPASTPAADPAATAPTPAATTPAATTATPPAEGAATPPPGQPRHKAPPARKEKPKTAKPVEPVKPPKTTATIVTNEGLSEHCILSTVVTAIDGKAVTAADKTDTFEVEPGEHSVSGYGGVDPTKCATFAGDNPVAITAGEHIGESTLKFTVVAGKSYYTGVDVRKADKSTWKLVVWQTKQ